ncbi:C-GCAxxG-C-C family protein [Clostridium sp. CX1]|uniref:C-GCAxxG-C-C family protein n=1 Tax=Clostridium tanneri TaxID=3037988 RepID=A0ABU4JX13_9CLOT|nr:MULTISPECIES: DV_1555 family C-GCAxxG-C-C protein [unclassified Clostridium]MCT8978533.1 C-GCAxxG-C-C family protein [Clostridium sp. CX1]MDW8802684.1 C-GCAxxG-C-C family protein [Clostridium sp. A1-XYC3]
MNDIAFDIYKLSSEGFCCTQILLKLALEEEGKENKDLIKAVNGLCGGIGFSKRTCGVVTGGICILSLYAGKGEARESKGEAFNEMINEYMEWFEEEFESIECGDIVGAHVISDSEGNVSYPIKCGNILIKSYEKLQEILYKHEYDFGERE